MAQQARTSTWTSKATHRLTGGLPAVGFALALLVSGAHAAGTAAGTLIPNTATMTFRVDGEIRLESSNTTRTRVDEVLDVVVVAEQGEPVAIASPTSSAVLSFLVSNTGNGQEHFVLTLEAGVNEGGFDPQAAGLFVEGNGIPGLQTGPGGDEPLVMGAQLALAPNENRSVYVQADIPADLRAYSEGFIRLQAVAATLIDATGQSDPRAPGFPGPGAAFPGAGDGGTTAVAGLTLSDQHPVFFAVSGFRIDAPVVTVEKVSTAVRAADGSDAVGPGAVVDYRVRVSVRGDGTVDNARLTDPLPVELSFVPGSLRIDGQLEDDDFEPADVDQAGYDAVAGALNVGLGALVGGGPDREITFSATIR
ncbi:MAG: hypothetical protein H6993_04215 [Pseudomonadales bacterium]|nr:hypothetical protein [Pseudomonadales bacterium]MCP5183141.1 hypothetical protein [Pseudomonadales bacterium]